MVNLDKKFNSLSSKIKKRRKAMGLSPRGLALKADLYGERSVYRIEQGIRDMKLSTLYKLAKALDVHPKELL